jgi:ATP-dependent RNA helicase RhlE
MPFRALGLDANILKAVQEAGYTEPTPIQSAAIPQVLSGSDLIGIAQTGTGKTAAFVLPILTRLAQLAAQGPRATRALVIAPTRELVVQIEENVRAYARHLPLKAATVFGGVGERAQIEALRSNVDLIVATPGRLLDLMNRRCGNFSQLSFLVLDEADRMLDMGFLPDIRRILRQLPPKRQTMLFSATLSKEIEGVTREFLYNPKLVQIGRRSNPAETVTQFVYEVPRHLKTALMFHLLGDSSLNMVLTFSRTKRSADKLARQLEQKGIRTATLHSNRSQNQRLRALKDFKSGAVRVLVATDIAARGIDVDGISHVINYDFPMHQEDYVHRIGRTGRAQAVGAALSFVCPEEQSDLRAVERFIGRGIVRKRAEGFNYSQTPEPRQPQSSQRQPQRAPQPRHQPQPQAQPHRHQPAAQPQSRPQPRPRDTQGSQPQRRPQESQSAASSRPQRPHPPQSGGERRPQQSSSRPFSQGGSRPGGKRPQRPGFGGRRWRR